MTNKIDITSGISGINRYVTISGRQLGEKQRNKFKLDELDKDGNRYIIVIPENIISITSSFFLGTFGDSINFFKNRTEFLNKYTFECNNNINRNIDDGINDALNCIDPLE